MASVRKRNYTDKSEYSLIYRDMRGVDFSGDGSAIARNRFAYLENMYRDYDGGTGAIESVPGYRKCFDTGATVWGMYSYTKEGGREMLAIHSGTHIFTAEADGTGVQTSDAVIKDGESCAFFSGGALYIMDGENIVRADAGGVSNAEDDIYVPCVAINGRDHEQRNLLTRRAYEKFVIGAPDDISFASEGLSYTILDSDARTCAIVDYSGTDTRVFIPARIKIGDNLYTVTEIGAYAFSEKPITECFFSGGVTDIGALAFYNCTKLKRVTLSDSVVSIGNGAFTYCRALNELHLGLGLRKIGNTAFNFTDALSSVTYAGNIDNFSAIENTAALGNKTIEYDTPCLLGALGIDIVSPAVSVEGVTVGGTDVPFECVYDGDLVKAVRVDIEDKSLATGKTVSVSLTLSSDREAYAKRHFGFVAAMHRTGDVARAITACRIAASYDGRIFLTGNREYPGVCFFSALTAQGEGRALYFGEYNYFRDGDGSASNVALLPTRDALAVLKDGQDGEGSIFYHVPESTGEDLIPTVYPVTARHGGIRAKGAALLFNDDPVFVTEGGLYALCENELGTARQVAHRSHSVDALLLSEDLSAAMLESWCGYLVLAVDGRIYLADSRATYESAGGFEYEWYFLTDVGSYTDDERVYRYLARAREGYYAKEESTPVLSEVMSVGYEDGTVYYTIEDGKRYEVYPTEERRGGIFHPLTRVRVIGKRLFFASSDGSVSVFNNDMRGVAPLSVKKRRDFDTDEYERTFAKSIHPEFYSHASHAVRYAISTVKDDCGIPHLPKSTVKNSLTVKCRAAIGGSITVEAGTDTEGYREVVSFPCGAMSFSDLDFSTLALITDDTFTVPLGERRRDWVEKQISVFTEAYCSPIGIYSIAYRFTVGNRIKLNKKGSI